MNWKKISAGLLGLNGAIYATSIILSFVVFSIWIIPATATAENLSIAPGTPFYLCANSGISSSYCQFFSINASTASNIATLNVSWFAGGGTACVVKFVNSSLSELADFSTNQTYSLPSNYPENATFGLKITRVSPKASSCDFTIEPIVN